MSYIKKDIRKLITSMDNQFTFDNSLKNWVKTNIYTHHNLIIKIKNKYYCTNCHKKFNASATIGGYIICPKCNNKLLVRFNTLKNYRFRDDFRVLEFIDGYFILRGFEVLSYYNNFKFKHHISEYQRLVIDKKSTYLLLSNKYTMFLGNCSVNHYSKHTSWRLHDSYYKKWYWSKGTIYFYNVENRTNNTPYYYCSLLSTLSNYNEDNIVELLQKILNNPTSYELLMKLNLTNLAKECDKFNIKGSFEKRFGVPKTYLPFMIKHNITYKELNALKIIRRKNIKIIRKLSTLTCFDDLIDRLDILKALDNGLNKDNEDIYRDYLDFAEQLKLNMKDKQILYPSNIKEAHDTLLKQIEDIKNKEMIENVEKRYIELKNNIYKDNKYIVYPVPSYADLLMESSMQNNCVRTYNMKYANHEVDLYFMRLLSNTDKSLVTIEVRDNIVVQSRIKNNRLPNKEQLSFIKNWETNILNTK